MNKTGKFKWVPMLIKAYVDAQTQLQRTRTASPGTTEVRPETAAAPLSTRPGIAGGPGREAARPQSQAQQSVGQSVRGGRQRPLNRVHPRRPNYQLLYRELRETKERLDHLEGMRQQLEEIQSRLDRHLTELSRKMESTAPERERES